MKIAGHDIGVCSWSLQPKDMADLIPQVRHLGLSHIQLALAPLLAMDSGRQYDELSVLRDSGLSLTATMLSFPGEDYSTIATIHETGGYVCDKHYIDRRDITVAAARLTQQLGVKFLSTHVGFIPASNHANYASCITRIREIAQILADRGLDLLMETGQERASELLQFLNDLACRNVGVNFDPANMILYGAGDPIDAIEVLGRHIRHVHVKDATLSDKPGTLWGEEVPFGEGEVGPARFLTALHSVNYTGPLVIEREAGHHRLADVAAAIQTLRDATG